MIRGAVAGHRTPRGNAASQRRAFHLGGHRHNCALRSSERHLRDQQSGKAMSMKAEFVPTSVIYRKPAVESAGGVVAAQSRDAAAAGARILAAGGHAVDAAVATSLALGTVEPWMSGLGGGGFATIWDAKRKEVRCLDYGMVAPAALDPADYPL